MAELTVPRVDFSSLGDLPQVYRDSQVSANRQRTLAELGQGASPADVARKLFAAGDVQGGMMLSNLANTQSQQNFHQMDANRNYNLRKEAIDNRSDTLPNQVEQRRAAAQRLGIPPEHPAYQSFVLTGKMPREDQAPLTATDKKAILDADEAVLTNKTVITALDEAKKLSPQAHTGWGASARATLGNNLPDWVVPNRVASPDSSAATANYENLVVGQALNQLKATFGAAPTEGERKILLELQASVGKPDKVRQDILDRAKGLAQKRLEFNEQRAQELRGGTYYKNRPAQQGASDPLSAAKAAIAKGADPIAVKKRLQENGIDPSGL